MIKAIKGFAQATTFSVYKNRMSLMDACYQYICQTKIWERRLGAAEKMIQVDPALAEVHFKKMLDDASPLGRELTVDILGLRYNLPVATLIDKLLNDQDLDVRFTTACVFTERKDPEAVGPLKQTIQMEKDSTLRHKCAEALGNIGGEEATEFLRALLINSKEDLVVRLVTASALGQINSLASISILFEALDTLDERMLHAVACSIMELTNPLVIPFAKQLLSDQRDWARRVATRSLAKFTRWATN